MSVSSFSNFFLNTWIWGMTWGIYHIPINVLVMLFFLKVVGKFKLMPSILMAVFSKIFASVFYTFIIVFFVYVAKFQMTFDTFRPINVLLECICLGIISAIFQVLFFVFLSRFYSIDIRFTTMIVFISNIISALMMYRFLHIA